MPEKEKGRIPKVVIVGAGFGGLWATKALAGAPVEVWLLDRNNYHTFLPLLYQVAAAELEPEEIAYPVRGVVRRYSNVRFMMTEVQGIDLEERAVLTSTDRLPYDYLILAAGSVTNFFGMESVAKHGYGMKDLREAVALRSEILCRFEEAAREGDAERRRGLLTFVIVGGGATGVEFAGTLAELIWQVLRRDYPEFDMDEARVLLIEATGTLLPGLPQELGEYARRALEAKGVEVLLNTAVHGATPTEVLIKDGEPIPAHTLVWSAGVRANQLADKLGVAQGRGARVIVEPTLQLPEHPEVYVVGDMAYIEHGEGLPVPQVAPAAIQQGTAAARNILRQIAGEEQLPFVYKDPGTMVTVGRNTGVARLWGRSIRGFLAWAAWLVVHLVKLIGFRNRLVVLTNWAWNYIFFDRAVRLILRR